MLLTRRAVPCLALALLLPLAPPPLDAQATTTPWATRLAIVQHARVAAITSRRFTDDQFWVAVAPALASPRFQVVQVGESMQGRPLRTVTFGHGPIKVLLWSQMHGDESTATMALADIFAYFAGSDNAALRDRIAERLTVTFLPLLNPDGAEIFQRHNAGGIDINRDVRRLASPEARTLKAVRDRIVPDWGFNLHDQSARTRVGTGLQAAIALLPPATEVSRGYTPGRTRARLLAAWLAVDFANAVPGRIAKYDDSYNPRAFGDMMQTWGASTVLIESGSLPNDPEKQLLRTYNAAAILGSLEAIATGAYEHSDPDDYESLPYNRGGASDLLVTGGTIVLPGLAPLRADIAINYDESVAGYGGHIREVGDLETAVTLDTLDLSGRFLHPLPEALTHTGGSVWLRIGAPAQFIIREGADPTSREVGRLPAADGRRSR